MADGFEAPPFAGARHEHFKDAPKISADGSVFYEDGRDVDIAAEKLALRRRHRGRSIALRRVLGRLGNSIHFASLYEALEIHLAVD